MLLYKNGEIFTLVSITVTLGKLVSLFLHIHTMTYVYNYELLIQIMIQLYAKYHYKKNISSNSMKSSTIIQSKPDPGFLQTLTHLNLEKFKDQKNQTTI